MEELRLRNRKPWARIFILLAIVLCARGASLPMETLSSSLKVTLDGNWRFRDMASEKWLPARVPGCVHLDLMENKVIPDPFYRDNEIRTQWVEDRDWIYEKEFNLDGEVLKRTHVELVCEGLDTFAVLTLNGTEVARTDNMFRAYRFDVGSLLRAGRNRLCIRFDSPVRRSLELEEKLSYRLPGGAPHVRKAPYHFGWDWGPRLVTSGIWRPIFIDAWDGPRIEDVAVTTTLQSNGEARLDVTGSFTADLAGAARIEVTVQGKNTFSRQDGILLKPGRSEKTITLVIPEPDLWWPAGMGEQNLYRVEVALSSGGRIVDRAAKRIGIRNMELNRRSDKWGTSFHFSVNGVPFFAKGGNWIPADSFPSRVTPARYGELLRSCVDANMNMLRVWGGGIYESPIFYDLCDELGIAIWQDFMFACALFPGDRAFLDNVEAEAEYVIRSLRHHPCLALWCGNNECEEGWFHWGWKDSLPAAVWEDYEKIFHQILPRSVRRWDGRRPYWPSSPHSEETGSPRSPDSGDMHYWGIWHGKEPFSNYRNQLHRFQSEFGFQSFPRLETVKSFTLPEDRNLSAPVMEQHQKHPQGNTLILHYMLDHYRLPKDFESLLWLSQVLQAEGMKTAVEHFRSGMPRIMGALYWQINDCWPVASWSGMDYFGNWKALHYYARRFYSPVLTALVEKEGRLTVYGISDLRATTEAEIRLITAGYKNGIISQKSFPVEIPGGRSVILKSETVSEWIGSLEQEEAYLYCELVAADRILCRNIHHFSPLKRVSLPEPRIAVHFSGGKERIGLEISSDRFAKDVYLAFPGIPGHFSDNFFDLVPGLTHRLEFVPEGPVTEVDLEHALQIRSLRDTY